MKNRSDLELSSNEIVEGTRDAPTLMGPESAKKALRKDQNGSAEM